MSIQQTLTAFVSMPSNTLKQNFSKNGWNTFATMPNATYLPSVNIGLMKWKLCTTSSKQRMVKSPYLTPPSITTSTLLAKPAIATTCEQFLITPSSNSNQPSPLPWLTTMILNHYNP